MIYDTTHKTKIELPEELICAYVDGTTSPDEDREVLAMMADDAQLAMFHDDLAQIMDVINVKEEDTGVEALEEPAFFCLEGGEMCCSAMPSPVECDDVMDGDEHPRSRVTPYMVTQLQPDEIFVFGSNPWGLHNGGASKLAREHFGARQGQGEGPQGQSYAIPTIVGGVERIRPYVDRFIEYARQHTHLHFIVARVGCGTAGFQPEDIAPLFLKTKDMPNVSLPDDFWRVINRL